MEKRRRVEKEATLREHIEYNMRTRGEAVPEPENAETEDEDEQDWEDVCIGCICPAVVRRMLLRHKGRFAAFASMGAAGRKKTTGMKRLCTGGTRPRRKSCAKSAGLFDTCTRES
jgi:hypothetical protein